MTLLKSTKLVVTPVTNLGEDALHIFIGLAALFAFVILFKKSLRDWQPLAFVFAVALAGTIWRMVDHFAHAGGLRFSIDWKTTTTMLFWPSILFLLARFTKVLKR